MWLKDVGTGYILSMGDVNFGINIINDKIRLNYIYNNGLGIEFDGVSVLQDGQWHFISVAKTASHSISFYVDGNFYGSFDASNRYTETNSSSVQIGGTVIKNINANTFKVDNIRFYSRTLSAAEIKEIYNAKQ
jgi:hypothetical protein